MSISDADIAFALELFAPLGGLSHRKMMGGVTLYRDGQIFALAGSTGTIYLKATGAFADRLAGEGAQKFTSTGRNGKSQSMGYWTLPDAAHDDPEVACDWARLALEHLGK